MTDGMWVCVECGYTKRIHLSDVIERCPECGSEYDIVEKIRPHAFHDVYIMKNKKTGTLSVPVPIAFMTNANKMDDVKKYKEIMSTLCKHIEEKKEQEEHR